MPWSLHWPRGPLPRHHHRRARRCCGSVQSTMREKTSAPMTRIFLAWPAMIRVHPHCQGVRGTRCSCGEVEGPGIDGAEVALHDAGGRRPRVIAGDRANDDQVEISGGDPGHFQRAPASLRGQVGGVLPVDDQVAFHDPGTGTDPLIVGIDQLFRGQRW